MYTYAIKYCALIDADVYSPVGRYFPNRHFHGFLNYGTVINTSIRGGRFNICKVKDEKKRTSSLIYARIMSYLDHVDVLQIARVSCVVLLLAPFPVTTLTTHHFINTKIIIASVRNNFKIRLYLSIIYNITTLCILGCLISLSSGKHGFVL